MKVLLETSTKMTLLRSHVVNLAGGDHVEDVGRQPRANNGKDNTSWRFLHSKSM